MDFVKGQLVRSKAGRDKTRTYAVLDVEGDTGPGRWQPPHGGKPEAQKEPARCPHRNRSWQRASEKRSTDQ